MTKATFFEMYFDQNETFSPSTRQAQYKSYKDARLKRHKDFSINHSAQNETPIQAYLQNHWQKADANAFYLYAAQIHDAVKLDFDLLGSLIQDTLLFNTLSQELKARIEHDYKDAALLLLDEATIANNRHDMAVYGKVLGGHSLLQPSKPEVPSEASPLLQSVQTESDTWLPYPETAIYWFGFANIYRLLARFFNLVWLEIWAITRALGGIDQSGNLAGVLPVDTAILESPASAFNILSLILFFGRFVVDFGMLLKHVFLPTEAEKAVNPVERARIEWRKRYQRMVNDLGWTLFNLLTNYGVVLGIAGPVTSWLLAAFLMFDVYWYGYKWYQADKALREHPSFTLLNNSSNLDMQNKARELLELRQLVCQLAKIRAEFLFNVMAAMLLVTSIILMASISASAWVAPICFFVCAWAVAMYITSDQFGVAMRARAEYQLDEAKYELNIPGIEGYKKSRLQAERQAWKKFALDFAEALIVPAVLIGLYTISWPAAVALTLAYIGFKIFMSNQTARTFVDDKVSLLTGCFWSLKKTESNIELPLERSGPQKI